LQTRCDYPVEQVTKVSASEAVDEAS